MSEGYAVNGSHGAKTNAWVSFLSTEVEFVLDLGGSFTAVFFFISNNNTQMLSDLPKNFQFFV